VVVLQIEIGADGFEQSIAAAANGEIEITGWRIADFLASAHGRHARMSLLVR